MHIADESLCFLTLYEMSERIHTRQISPADVDILLDDVGALPIPSALCVAP
jgi:hypothetical protein